jgi:hypothetical protein
VIVRIDDVALLVEHPGHPLVAQGMLGCPVLHLDHRLCLCPLGHTPAVDKYLVPFRVCEGERGILRL